ncbi:MAG TPA: YjbH domain-containing protein, partial [Ferrovaceae bacterium]|nr:YjbH domain-containing protein [Ferrovaceae bacterium]
MPKLSDPPLVPVNNSYPANHTNWKITSLDIETQTKWKVLQITQHKNILFIDVANPHNVYWREYLDRAIRVLHRDASFGIDYFVFRIHEEGLLVAEEHVDRGAWLTQHTEETPPSLTQMAMMPVAPLSTLSHQANQNNSPPSSTQNTALYSSSIDQLEFHNGLNFNYFLGGPNNFILYSLAPYEEVRYHINNDTWVQGTAQYNVFDNYNNFTYDAPSNLPRVRTYIREYVTTSRLTMPNLQLTSVKNIAPDQYVSFYAGYLEMMFGGVGSEYLYRPFDSQFALGVDINEVAQRNFNVGFGFQNYRVLTGLATLYWDTGWQGVHTNLSMGRYLAGDVGATLDISKQFKNGVQMGAYATKTNVTSAQFGEGSIDKGIYVNIPFDALLTRSTDLTAHFLWEPLLRDGGARLNRAVQLYDLTSARSHQALQTEPAPQNNTTLPPSQQTVETTSTLVTPRPYLVAREHVTKEGWDQEPYHYTYDLEGDLYQQGFTHIDVLLDDSYRLHVALTPPQYAHLSDAAGQALRTIVNRMPLDTREIILTINSEVVYTFHDIKQLKKYLNGLIDDQDIAPTITFHTLNNGAKQYDLLFGLNHLQAEPHDLSSGEALLPRRVWINRVYSDFTSGIKESKNLDWGNTLLIGSSLVLGSSLLDHPFDRFALNHGQGSLVSRFKQVGNDLPFVTTGLAGLIALGSQNLSLSDTGYSAGEAAVSGYILSLGLKTLVGRARPFTNQGSTSFHILHGSASSGTDSFPSAHNIVTWASITPFAKEYDAPWLYAVAGLTNASRVMGRNHWFSDTVAGAFIGYNMGNLFWSSQQKRENAPEVYITPMGVNMDMKF